MKIHIVKSKTNSVSEHSTGQCSIGFKSTSDIWTFDSKILIANRSSSISNIRNSATSIATIEILPCSFKRKFYLVFEPIMKPQWSCLCLSKGGKIKASFPVGFVELTNWFEYVSWVVVVSWTVPILKANFIFMRLETTPLESSVSPNIFCWKSIKRKIIIILTLCLFLLLKRWFSIDLMNSKDNTLATCIMIVNALLELCLRQDQSITILTGLDDKTSIINIDSQHIFIIVLTRGGWIPIFHPLINGSTIFLQFLSHYHLQRWYFIPYFCYFLQQSIFYYLQITTFQQWSQIVIDDRFNAAIEKAVSTDPTIASIALGSYFLHERV